MNQKPKYLLKYLEKEIENDSLEELIRLAKNLTVRYEIFRVYKSAMFKDERNKSVLTIKAIEEAKRLHGKGYSNTIISRQLGLGRFYIDKIIGKNAII